MTEEQLQRSAEIQQMRDQLAAAADTIAILRAEIERLNTPWWRRLAGLFRRLR